MTCLTGEEILKRKRWGFEDKLIEAYKRGLSPYRQFDGARMTTGSKCFNCTKASPGYKPGFLNEQGVCAPIELRDAPDISPFPPFGLRGLEVSYPPLELAMKIDPALVEHFFKDGEFVFNSGVFNNGIRPQVARLVTGVLGSSKFERLMLEGICSDFDPMGKLDMGDRLRAAKFKLKEVEEYERRHMIGSVIATESGAIEPGQGQQLGVPQLDPPEFLPATSQEYNEMLRQRGFADPAARMYMIRNAQKPPWGKMTNYNAAAIALGRLIPEDKDEIDRLNSRYTEHVHNGLLAHLPKSKRTKKKQS